MTLADVRSRLDEQGIEGFWNTTAVALVRNTALVLELVTGAEASGEAAARAASVVATSRQAFDGLLTAARCAADGGARVAEVERLALVEGWAESFFELQDPIRETLARSLTMTCGPSTTSPRLALMVPNDERAVDAMERIWASAVRV